MSVGFRQAYRNLADFVVKHTEIEIGESVISIPESVRPDFYRLFNAAREAFILEKFPSHLARAGELRQEYDKEVKDASSWLILEDPPAINPVRRFLSDPGECLARELFDPLFDLLKGRISLDQIEKRGAQKIEELFAAVYRGGYEKWAMLGLLNLLGIERAFRVNVRNLNPGERSKPAAQAPAEEVPFPQESTRFYFSQPRNAIFAVPDLLVYSSRLRHFVGVRSEFRESAYNAINASHEREWIGVDTDLLKLLSKGLTLIYTSERAENIALVADVAKFCMPDMLLWCVDAQSVDQQNAIEIIGHTNKRLRPSRGIYIIVNGEWAETTELSGSDTTTHAGEETERICWLNVGYERTKLLPVAEALLDSTGTALAT